MNRILGDDLHVDAVTKHAIDRYMERLGSKKVHRAIGKIFTMSSRALNIGDNRYYSNGWIIVVVDGLVRTVYRPRTHEQMYAINKATERARKKQLKSEERADQYR
jgi:hypothetical protein